MSPAEPVVRAYVAVRAAIVAAYAEAWATDILAEGPPSHPALPPRLVYLDLHGAPNRTLSQGRPVLGAVAACAAQSSALRSELALIFNGPKEEDLDADNVLRTVLDPAGVMVHRPQLIREHPWPRIDARLDAIRPAAVLAHVEPAGYTGLGNGDGSRCLRRAGAEVFLTLRYPMLNMGASNPGVAGHLDAFWGEARSQALREALAVLSPQGRLGQIVAASVSRLHEWGADHVMVFRLGDGHRCQELLLHASRDSAAYARAKEVMARFSTGHDQGVPAYTYDPIAARYDHGLPVLHSLDALADELGTLLASQIVTVEDVYRRHHVGRPYILQNYREALDALASQGRAYRTGSRLRVLR